MEYPDCQYYISGSAVALSLRHKKIVAGTGGLSSSAQNWSCPFAAELSGVHLTLTSKLIEVRATIEFSGRCYKGHADRRCSIG